MANQVTLTFAGEEKPLVDSMARVGSSAENMSSEVGSAAKHVSESSGEAANGFSRTGEAADKAESNIIGVHDVIDGTATIMQGPGKVGIVGYIQGWADLAGGLAPILLSLAETKAATIAQGVASKAAAVGTSIWTGAQRLLNLAFVSSPIGWIVLGIGLLVAAVVLIATKTTWFQTIWRVAWGAIKSAAEATWNFVQKIPGWTESAFKNIARVVSAPYRAAFNLIADAWNSTIGRLSWTVPGWVPFLGGHTISVPNLPHFHAGGRVPGGPSQEMLAVLRGGETIGTDAGGGGQGFIIPGDPLIRMIVDYVATEVRKRGGRPENIGLKPA